MPRSQCCCRDLPSRMEKPRSPEPRADVHRRDPALWLRWEGIARSFALLFARCFVHKAGYAGVLARHGTWREPVNPYYVNTGYAMAPATSANDSEQQSLSSDADSLSLTDSSVLPVSPSPTEMGSLRTDSENSTVERCRKAPKPMDECHYLICLDGIPPYRFRKLHRREMQESAKANGRVPLPHMPRTYRIPKDIHVEPQKFAAELSSRLEGVLREREAQEKLEERLKRVRLEEEGDDADVSPDSAVCVSLFQEEEGDDADVSAAPSLVSHKLPPVQPPHHFNSRYSDMSYSGMQLRDAHEENPESILDEHVQRVMKTPGCHSPKSRSPDGLPAGKHPSKPGLKAEGSGMYHHKHVYHHTHHHGTVKPKEQAEGEASQRGQSSLAWNGDPHHYATKSRNYADSMGMAPNTMDSLGHRWEEEGDDADVSPDSAVCVSLFQEEEGDDADVSPDSAVCVSLFQEEEGDDADVSAAPSLVSHKLPPVQPPHHFNSRYSDMSYSGMQLRDAHEENPESILDEHVQRVMKTPGCHSPKSRSPDGLPAGKHPSKPGLKAEGSGMYHHKHVYHHTHHHGTVKPKEQAEGEASQRGQSSLAWNGDPHHYATKSRNYADSMGMAPNTMDSLGHSSKGSTLSKRASKKVEPLKTEDSRNFEMPAPPEDMERNQKILQWMMEGEKESGRHKKTPYGSTGGVKKVPSHEPSRPSSIERPGAVHPWVTAQLRNNVQPSHPFIQDPTMPPNPAPNPLTQLEEARRRLEEERKRAAPLQAKQRHRTQKKQPCESLVVAYYFCGEPIPYRTSVKGRVVTLGQFKELLTKKGSYRYYFKKVSDEFDCGVVFEEVREDDAILPIFEEKIIGKVEKID
ncbi:UNVERIFIED_CONTAM: hypothetical protein FKN15_059727 [Acipenser sinensis]